MRRFHSSLIGIDEGDLVLFSDFEHNGPMWVEQGARAARHEVSFSEPFSTPPSVHVSLSMWDVSNATMARMDVRAEEISATGFILVFRTWGDTKIARARASWRAIGELVHDEDWHLY